MSTSNETLTATEAESLARLLADAMRGGLSLPAALQRVASQPEFARVAEPLAKIAGDLERGQGIDAFLRGRHLRTPAALAGLIEAAARGRDPANVLTELIDIRQRRLDHHRTMFKVVAYPALIGLIAISGLIVFLNVLVPPIGEMFSDFELHLPADTGLIVWFSKTGQWFVWPALVFLPVALLVAWLFFPRSTFHWLVSIIPFWGRIHWWLGCEAWLRSLAVLVDQNIPLPESLRLAAGASEHGIAAEASTRLATSVERGGDLAKEIAASDHLPRVIAAYVQAGLQRGKLTDGLRAAADVLGDWASSRSKWVVTLPFALMIVLAPAISIRLYQVLMGPMTLLIEGLSGAGNMGSRDNIFILISGAGMLIVVFSAIPAMAVWFAYQLMVGNRENHGWPVVALRMTKVILQVMLVLGFVCAFLGIAILWMLPMSVAALISFWALTSETARRSLLWHLAVASDQGVPLFEAAYACAAGRGNPYAKKCLLLAQNLERGTPVLLAMRRAGIDLPLEDRTVVAAAAQSGRFGEVLRAALERKRVEHSDTISETARVSYLMMSGATALFVVAFVMLKIVPVMTKMLAEFGMTAGPEWRFFIVICRDFTAPLVFGASLVILLAICFDPLTRNWFSDVFAFLFGVGSRRAGSIIARMLATLLPLGWPIERALASLGQQQPDLDRKLGVRRVMGRLEQGQPPIDAMTAAGWFTASEAGTLHAAARVGNLPFAFEQVAEQRQRRANERSRFWVHLFSNLGLLLGLAVAAMLAWVILGPLVLMIEKLST